MLTLDLLPKEILVNIFSYLSYRRYIQALSDPAPSVRHSDQISLHFYLVLLHQLSSITTQLKTSKATY